MSEQLPVFSDNEELDLLCFEIDLELPEIISAEAVQQEQEEDSSQEIDNFIVSMLEFRQR